jgi:predicted AlkP superfamily phosphohydrolase/phosphomutase
MGNPKVFIVGLDGATFDIIYPMIAKGQLPTLSRLIDTGTHGVLKSTTPDLSPVAWTSMITGKKPGSHAIFDFISRQPDSYKFASTRGCDRKAQSIWSLLSQNGKKVGVINVTMSYPPEKVNGFLVSGIDTPGLESTFTYPPSLYNEIKEKVGQYVLVNPYAPTTREKHIHGMFEMLNNRLATTEYLMKKYEWDFFMVVFIATDGSQHFYWKDMDSTHPDHNVESPEPFKRAIFDVYTRLDKGIGDLMECLEDNTTVILVSDHGFHPLHKLFVLKSWLIQEGYLTLKKGLMSSVNYDKWIALGKKLRDKLPYGSIRKNKHKIIPSQSINWKKTKAFAEGTFGYIFINLKGRDAQGIVNPGKEYDELCDRIMKGLKTVRDPENGRPVVEDVFRREEIFSGPYEDIAPDLIITSRQNYFVTASNERFSRIQDKRSRSNSMFQKHTWSGNHVPGGIFIINGPNIKRGCKIQGARIIDIAPTTLYLLAQEIPRDMDGKVLLDAFNSEHTETNVPKFKEADHLDKDNKSLGELLPEEDEEVKERLRNLGYLD